MTVSLPFIPNGSTTGNIELTEDEVPFGEGYMQTAEQFNSLREVWNVSFGPVTLPDGAEIIRFFREHRGRTIITWTPPGEPNALRFRMRGPLSRRFNGATMDVSFVLRQVYDYA